MDAPTSTIGPKCAPKEHFWLRFHQLAQAFESQGITDVERLWTTKADLARMPPEMQQETLSRIVKMGGMLSVIADDGK